MAQLTVKQDKEQTANGLNVHRTSIPVGQYLVKKISDKSTIIYESSTGVWNPLPVGTVLNGESFVRLMVVESISLTEKRTATEQFSVNDDFRDSDNGTWFLAECKQSRNGNNYTSISRKLTDKEAKELLKHETVEAK